MKPSTPLNPQKTTYPRFHVWRWALLFAGLAASSCELPKEPRFDHAAPARLHDFVMRADEVVAESESGKLSVAQRKTYLTQSIVFVDAMIERERLRSEKGYNIERLRALREQLHKIQARGTALRKADGYALRASLGNVDQWRLYSGLYSPENSDTPTTSETTDTTCSQTESKKHDRENRRERNKDDDGRKSRR